MNIRYLVIALAICALGGTAQTEAQESLVTHKSMAPAIALDLAQAAWLTADTGAISGSSCRPLRCDPGGAA
jgi:hypothetical protein